MSCHYILSNYFVTDYKLSFILDYYASDIPLYIHYGKPETHRKMK